LIMNYLKQSTILDTILALIHLKEFRMRVT
jgi:hypothetical protein